MSSLSYPIRHHVPPDQTTTFPIETMTDRQREVFSEFLTARRTSQLNLQEPISVARLLVRHKPGVTLSPLSMPSIVDYVPAISVEDIPNVFDLEYMWENEETLTTARTSWRLDLLPHTDEWSDALPRRAGVVLGYPDEDIEHYLHSEPPDTSPKAYLERGIFDPEDVAFTRFIPQRHADSIPGFERAIETGKEIWGVLSRYATRWDLPELKQYMKWLYQQALAGLYGDDYLYQLHWLF